MMMVLCSSGCRRYYDDEQQWTICPHGPLWGSPDAYCAQHDLVNCTFRHGQASWWARFRALLRL